MRYIQHRTSDDQPIFEGDTLNLDISDKDLGGSYFGSLTKMYKVNNIVVDVFENGTELEVKYGIKFFNDEKQVVTKKEEAYWSYLGSCKDKKVEVVKSFEDFDDVEDGSSLYEPIETGTMFFTYLAGKGFKKTSGYTLLENEKERRIPDSELSIAINDDITLFVGQKVLVELDEAFDARVSESYSAYVEELIVNEYTHLAFELTRYPDIFNYDLEITFTDKDGNPSLFTKELSNKFKESDLYQETSNKRRMQKYLVQKLNREFNDDKSIENEKELDNAQKILEEMAEEIYNFKNDLKNVNVLPYTPFFGMNAEKFVLKTALKQGLKFKII